MSRNWVGAAAVVGALAVGMGAFGAHALEPWLEGLSDGAKRLHWWRTAASYHLWHALALGLCAVVRGKDRAGRVAPWALLLGTLLFSGSLYAMTLSGIRALGAVTPLGGMLLIMGWLAMATTAWRSPGPERL